MIASLALLCRGGVGGSTSAAIRTGLALAARGARVELFCEREPLWHSDLTALTVHTWGCDPNPLPGGRTADSAGVALLLEQHAAQPFEVIHAHFAVPHTAIAARARRYAQALGLPRPALVTTLHGSEVLAAEHDRAAALELLDALRWSDAYATPSASLGKRLRTPIESKDHAKQALLVPNFLLETEMSDTFFAAARSRHQPDRLQLLHLTNYRPLKRSQVVIEAFLDAAGELAREQLPIALTVIGEGPERGSLEAVFGQAAQRRGLQDSLHWRGARPLGPGALDPFDALLIGSRYESFSVAALEAMGAGLAVVAPAVGGLPELTGEHHDPELLDPMQLETELPRAIVALARDPERLRRAGLQGQERARARFRADVGLAPTLELYAHGLRRAEREPRR